VTIRTEHIRLLRGEGRYVDDIEPPGCLHVAFVRSMLANAWIRAIDVSQAEALSGVELVLTADRLGRLAAPLPLLREHDSVTNPRTQPPLATDLVSYVGQPIVAVVARSRYVAEDAAELVEVDYDPRPASVDLESAARGDALVHDGVAQNLAGVMYQRVGDPDRAFQVAPRTTRLRLSIERSCGSPMETRGVVAIWDPRVQRLEVWDSTQNPIAIHHGLARMFGVSEDQVRVAAPDVGGGFGTKIMIFYPEEVVVPFAARQLGRPVKWIEDRQEHLLSAHQERGQLHDAEIAFDQDGTILAVRTNFLHDTGAFTPYGPGIPEVTITHIRGQYAIEHFEATARIVYTNTPPVTPYRGAGRPQAVFVMERLIAAAARQLGLEPLEVRRRNLITGDVFPYDVGLELLGMPVVYDSGNYPAAFELMNERLSLPAFRSEQARAREEGRHIGIGFATYVEGAAPGPYENAVCRLDATGHVLVTVAPPSQGQGHHTTLTRIVAQALGVNDNDVQLIQGDSGRQTSGSGTFGSRVAVVAGSAVAEAARDLRRQLVSYASHLLECAPEDVVIQDGNIGVVGAPDSFRSLRDLATSLNAITYPSTPASARELQALAIRRRVLDGWPIFEGRGVHVPRNMTYGSGLHGAVVEVEASSGRVDILRYVVIDDCGVALDPDAVRGQIHGGVAQGVGGALLERLVFDDDGQPLTASFLDFLLPTIDDVPEIEVDSVETPSPLNPLGAKGVGEAGVIAVSAAVAEAIEDALSADNVEIDTMPLSPEAVVDLIQRARS
jgi:CO/xanthine dehydrogenase Mo-binding subunit